MWFPTHVHTMFSLLDGLSKPEQIANRLWECGYSGTAVTDHGSISSVPSLIKACKEICKNCGKQNKQMCKCGKYEAAKLKVIPGCEYYICQQDPTIKTPDNSRLSHLCVLAKGEDGWKRLIKATSAASMPDHFYKKPRLSIEKLGEIGGGQFIVFSGHLGSDLANICFNEPKLAYKATTYEEAKALVRPDWRTKIPELIKRYQNAFGEANFYLEIQLVDAVTLPAALVVARILRHFGKELGIKCVATADSHYCRKEDADDQRILLCSALNTTYKEILRKLAEDEDVSLGAFFRSNNYHIPSLEEMQELHKDHPDELANSLEIASRCEPISLSGKPMVITFNGPNGESPEDFLAELCKKGFQEKIVGRIPSEKLKVYADRLWEEEFPVIKDAGLASYFLTVWDFVNYARNTLKSKVGKGRGSAAGCLISYLIGITQVDPIKYDLLFSRFYNAGRNQPGKIALPDIDCDFAIAARDKVVEYIRHKYGRDKVSQMATFGRMQGRSALKDVLRAKDRCGFDEMNRITEAIPDEAAIADQLQEMREETGEASIIGWALENNPDELKEWCSLREDGELEGPLALDFAQAIRLEGTKRSMGKHASGLIISPDVLSDIVPMIYDKSSEEMIVGLDMRDAETLGLVKYDLLGLRTLSCIMDAEALIRGEL